MVDGRGLEDVVVVGAGPGGLAVAGALRMRGADPLVLDAGAGVGERWRTHYERLHLHTPRGWSHLPGYRIPRRFGRWVARDDVVRYLEEYTAHHRLRLRTRTAVDRIDPGSGSGDARWHVHLADGTTVAARDVVVATGYNHTPVMPAWPGRDGFTGEMLHARDYRNGRPWAGRDVLVVGTGNTGTEIATDLAEHGATRVWLSVRTPPHIVARDRMGLPAQATGIAVRRLPPRLVDRVSGVLARVQEPDLTEFGMPRAAPDLYSRTLEGRVPVQDVGIVGAIRARRVEPVAALEAFDGDEVVLADGTRLRPALVVTATGYRAGLEPLVGHLGVLGERGLPTVRGSARPEARPGLWFTGFTNPISGMLRELRIDAGRIAAGISPSRGGARPRG